MIPNEIDTRALRDALGMFATGVTIVTARPQGGAPIGLTVSSFNAVSLAPPLIVWSLQMDSHNLEAFRTCSHYAVNVLAEDQVVLSERFAAPVEDRFAGLDLRAGLGEAPLIPGCCAWFECRNEIRHPGGDHLLFIGLVERFARAPGRPLLYFGGRYAGLAEL
jgi:flavin reductase (DIM6/NTAB) family NADH-FMN oxidoreductase RutF